MPRASVDVRGKQLEWSVTWNASQEQIDAMRADGIDIWMPENSIPAWVVDIGLLRPWCFFQDIWNFKNPFKG
jgi:hypothetical protein